MKGNNKLVLNQETIIEAVQYWLNSRIVGEVPKVLSVDLPRYESDFVVTVQSPTGTEGPQL